MGSINKCEIINGQKVLTPFVQTNSVEDYYSTEEEATNKVWIDGKRIYRKVLTVTTTAVITDQWTVIPGWTVVDASIDQYVVVTFPVGNRVDYNINAEDKSLTFATLVGDDLTIQAGTALIIEYTKV